MSRTFVYCRVSTAEQTTENQIAALRDKGVDVRPDRVIEETISGSVQASDRPKLSNLVNNKLEQGDVLCVLKMDRLGRDVVDLLSTVDALRDKGVSVRCFDLDGVDLTSAAGRFQLTVLAAVAQFERDRIIERTKEGLHRARSEGKTLGRPKASHDAAALAALVAEGKSNAQIAAALGVSRATAGRLAKDIRESTS